VKRAVLTWAGNEQAGSVQLLSFLEANSQHWKRLQLPEPAATEPQLPPVLRAITRAAQLLYHSDLAHRLGSAVESAVAAAANTAADEPDGEEQQQQQQLGEVIDPKVLEAVRGGAAATQAELKIAQDITKEVQVGPLCGCCAGVVKAIVQDSGVAP
jgi:bacterioferritin-associated ferredoxin